MTIEFKIDAAGVAVQELDFPCLCKSRSNDAIWLFSAKDRGTCITGIHMGASCLKLQSSKFKPFKGDVTLTQE